MQFKNLPAKKLKVLMALFFGTGIFGIIIGHGLGEWQPTFMYTLLGVTNLILGAFVLAGFFLLESHVNQERNEKNSDITINTFVAKCIA